MAGSHHTGRRSWRPGTVQSRDMLSILDGRRQAEADIRKAIYVKPYGYGFHVVKNICNDQEYVVADGLGFKRTFRPGTPVTLASQTGQPGEILIAGPPSGLGGASGYAVQAAVRPAATTYTPPTPPEPEPEYTAVDCNVWFDGTTMYAAWAAYDAESNYYLQIGTFTPEHIEEEPAELGVGDERATIPAACEVLYTIPDADLDPGYADEVGLFAVFGDYAVVQPTAGALVVIDLTDGSVVSAIDGITFSGDALDHHVPLVTNNRLVLYVDGDIVAYDWPTLDNPADISAPTQVNTEPLGFAEHASGVAFFRKGNGIDGREKVYRWLYNTNLGAVAGPTLYSLTGSSVVTVNAAYVVYSSGSYLLPCTIGAGTPTYGYLSVNAAHDGQATVDATWWDSDHVPSRAWLASTGGAQVAGTDPGEGYTFVVHRISDGVRAFMELVEPAPPPV